MAFGSTWLTERLKEFVDLFADVEARLLTDHELDLGMREAESAIRMSPPASPT